MQWPLRKQMRKSMRLKLCKCSCTRPMSRFATLPSNELVLQPYNKKFALFFDVFFKNASFCNVFSVIILKTPSFCSVFSAIILKSPSFAVFSVQSLSKIPAIILKTRSFCSVFSAIILKNPSFCSVFSAIILKTPSFAVFSVQSFSKIPVFAVFQV